MKNNLLNFDAIIRTVLLVILSLSAIPVSAFSKELISKGGVKYWWHHGQDREVLDDFSEIDPELKKYGVLNPREEFELAVKKAQYYFYERGQHPLYGSHFTSTSLPWPYGEAVFKACYQNLATLKSGGPFNLKGKARQYPLEQSRLYKEEQRLLAVFWHYAANFNDLMRDHILKNFKVECDCSHYSINGMDYYMYSPDGELIRDISWCKK